MVKLKYFLKNLKKPIFLKIDVQGYELEVLKGASLNEIKYIYLEASYIQLYKKQPLIDDIIRYLSSKNFKLIKKVILIIFNIFRLIYNFFYE